MTGHLPVLLREVIELLSPKEGGIYIDATVGLGGHSEEVLKRIGQNGRVIGIDRDEEALRRAGERLHDGRLILRKGKFSDLGSILPDLGIEKADGILFDLGVSMMQLKEHGRGFSFLSAVRLDMRMDPSEPFSAWDVVNGYSEADLIRVLREYGEEYRAPRIARAIVRERQKAAIDTCDRLAGIVARAAGRTGRTHPATRTFQAIRIEVNQEMRQLADGLKAALAVLGSGGRLCVISYHSLEDRMVKHFIRDNARDGMMRPLTKKPVVPGAGELRENPSARSARLRGAERL